MLKRKDVKKVSDAKQSKEYANLLDGAMVDNFDKALAHHIRNLDAAIEALGNVRGQLEAMQEKVANEYAGGSKESNAYVKKIEAGTATTEDTHKLADFFDAKSEALAKEMRHIAHRRGVDDALRKFADELFEDGETRKDNIDSLCDALRWIGAECEYTPEEEACFPFDNEWTRV